MAVSDDPIPRAGRPIGAGVLVVGGLTLAFLARGPLEMLGTGHADTPDVGLVLAAVPPLVLAVVFVAQGLGMARAWPITTMVRLAAAALLVGAVLPLDQLGELGWLGNAGMAAGAVGVAAASRRGGGVVDP